MPSRHQPIDLGRVRTSSIATRPSKVERAHFGRPVGPRGTVAELIDSLPRALAADDLRALLAAMRAARSAGRAILWMLGGHVVKCGLAPVLESLMEDGFVTAVAMNGACAIHDAELAIWGKTSEDVAERLVDGSFGMAEETAEFMNDCARRAAREARGLGETIGARLVEVAPDGGRGSVVASAHRLGLAVTVHVALGTDVVHQHASADGAAIGAATFHDFRLLASVLRDLHGGGVVLNVGSAVLMPEVFLKALTVARNVAGPVEGFTAASFDFVRQYRPHENVVRRPTAGAGRGVEFVGHHEIMLPLLAAALAADPPPGT
jgi:hypothetical protein